MERYIRINCSCCGQPLLATGDATAIRCTACSTVVTVDRSSTDPLVRFHKKVIKSANWVKGQIHQVSSSTNFHYPSSTMSNFYSQPYLLPLSSHNPQSSNMLSYANLGNHHHQQGNDMNSPISPIGNIYYGHDDINSNLNLANYPHASKLAAPSYGKLQMYPSVHGKKRALLCGVSYKNRKCELKGTINDVNCMRYLLRGKFGFPDTCILVLSEEEKDPSRIPTKQNMRNAMRWLVNGCQPGDSLVFHYSGHGSQQMCYGGDEIDGLDEALCPLDFETEGKLVDDEINETIVRPLPKGAKLHAIVDACHSGTVLDLPFVCKMNRAGFYQWENQIHPSIYKGTSGGLAISFSSCQDSQTSADTSAFAGNTSTGAMTYCFIQVLESEPGLTYGRLLNAMRSSIREAKSGLRPAGPICSLLNKLLRHCFTQEPQLTASEQFDIYRTPFML